MKSFEPLLFIGKLLFLFSNGWHLPGLAEWLILINYCGGELEAGAKLKETGTTNWNAPNKSEYLAQWKQD